MAFTNTLTGEVLPGNTRSAWEASPGWPGSPLKQPDLIARIKTYNTFHEGTRLQVKSQEGQDSLLIEGSLRINWDVKSNISFQKLDDTVPVKEENNYRKSYCAAIENGLDESLLRTMDSGEGATIRKTKAEVEQLMTSLSLEEMKEESQEKLRYNTIGGVVVRRRKKPQRTKRRLSMINGHIYDLDTSNFTPSDGSVTSVRVTSRDNAPAVIRLLLHKFKVQNNPDEFCLCSVKKTGETKILKVTDYPLMERVIMGPLEEEAKIFLRNTSHVKDVSNEVAQFMNLPEPMLNSFLQKIDDDERMAYHRVIVKYQRLRRQIEDTLTDLETPSWGID